MRLYRMLSCLLLAGLFLFSPALTGNAHASAALTPEQKKEVESVVRELLTKKEPELVIKAAQAIQSKEEAKETEQREDALSKNTKAVFEDPTSPIGGNPKGDVIVVEFFDYSCGYCKMTQKNVGALLKKDKNIRVIYKELPILGEGSMLGAKAALASLKQDKGKYEAFHEALMSSQTQLNDNRITTLAKQVGLDAQKLKEDMKSKDIEAMIQANTELAQTLGIRGTPSFVIGKKLYPGALSFEQMEEAVKAERSK